MSLARRMFFSSAFLAFAAAPALAGGVEISGAIQVSESWTRATVRGASVGAGYMTIDNRGGEADALTGASSDRAERVEIHESREEDGIMTMRAAPKEGLKIKPGKQLVLKPGGYHMMLIGLKSALLPGEIVHLTLHFARAGDVGADLTVEGFGAQAPGAGPKPAAKPDKDNAVKEKSNKDMEEPPSISY
jgi:copper(I)-binding protein